MAGRPPLDALGLAAALAAAVVLYAPVLVESRFNAVDDPWVIQGNPLVMHPERFGLLDYFRVPELANAQEYMPLKTLSHALDARLFGATDAIGFRPQQMLWWLASIVATWWWWRTIALDGGVRSRSGVSEGEARGFVGAAVLLWTLHPVHVESYAWLTGRKDLMAGTFMALAACAAWRARPGRLGEVAVVCALTVLSLLSKPTATALPVWVVGADALRGAPGWSSLRARLPVYAAVILPAAAFALLYKLAFAAGAAELRPAYSFMTWSGPAWARAFVQLGEFVRLCVDPFGQVIAHPAAALPADPGSLRFVLTATAGAAVVAALVPGALWGSFALVLPVLLAGATWPILVMPVYGQYVAGRWLFHGVAGVLLPAVALVVTARALPVLARAAVATAAAAVLFAASWAYTLDFCDPVALARRTTRIYPGAVQAELSLLRLLDGPADAEAQTAVARACLARMPGHGPCAARLARRLVPAGAAEEAEARLVAALDDDRDGEAAAVLVMLLVARNRASEAMRLLTPVFAGGRAAASALPLAVAATTARNEPVARAALGALINDRPADGPPDAAAHIAEYAAVFNRPDVAARVRVAAGRARTHGEFRAAFVAAGGLE